MGADLVSSCKPAPQVKVDEEFTENIPNHERKIWFIC
jgi:hypothetical protein